MANNEELNIKVQLKVDEGKSKSQINDFIKEMNDKNKLNKIKLDLDLKNVDNTLKGIDDKLDKIGNKVKDTFQISNDAVKGFKQLEKTFKEFNKMTNASQKALHGYFEDVQKGVSDIKKEAKQLDNTLEGVTKTTQNLGRDMGKEAVKMVRYLDSSADKLKAQFTEKQNARDSLVTSVFGDGRTVRKQVSDIEGASKKIIGQYDKTYKAINKYEGEYKKASLGGNVESQKLIGEVLEKQYDKIAKLDHMVAELGLGDRIKHELDEIVKASNTDFRIKMGTIDDKSAKDSAREEKQNINELQAEYKRLLGVKSNLMKQSLGTTNSDEGYATLQRHLKDVQQELDKTSLGLMKYGNNLTQALDNNSALKSSQDNVKALENLERKITSVNEAISKVSKSSYVDDSAIEGLLQTLERVSSLNVDSSIEDIVHALKELDNIKIDLKGLQGDIVDSRGTEKIGDFIEDYLQKIRRLQRESGQYLNPLAIDDFVASLQGLNNVPLDRLQHEMSNVRRSFRDMTDEVSHVQSAVEDGFFANLYDNLTSFQLGDAIGDMMQQSVTAVLEGVKEFDSAMRDYRKVAQESWIDTPKEMDNIGTSAIRIAKEVGMSSNDVVTAMADTISAGIGKTKKDIEEVSRMSMMLANVGDVSQQQASQYFNSILSAFKFGDGKNWASQPLKEVDVFVDGVVKKTTQLEKVTDILNFVGNKYSITSSGIAEALMRSGSVLSTYGNSYEQSVAMITGANASIQDPTKVGNGLKTITMRMAGLTYKTKEGRIALNSTGDALQKIAKIDLVDKKTGKLKNVYQMLDELKGKWGDLNDQEKRALTEAMAGKNQANIMASLLDNWGQVEEIMGRIGNNNAEFYKSATKENAQYTNSIEGKLNKLKETWKEVYTTIVSSDFAKALLDIAIKGSEGIAKLIKTLDGAGLTLPALALGFLNLKNSLSFLGTGGSRGAVGGIFRGGIFDGNNWRRFGSTVMNSENRLQTFRRSLGMLGGTTVGLGNRINNLGDEIHTTGGATEEATRRTGGFRNGLRLAMSSINPLNIGLGVLSGVLQGALILGLAEVVKKTGEWAYSNHNARVSIDKNTKAHKEELKTLEYKKKSLGKIAEEYDKLNHKKPKDRTSEEKSKLKELTNEIANLYPELKSSDYDPQNPILLTTKDAKQLADELQRAIDNKKKLLNQDAEAKGSTAWTKLNKYDDHRADDSIKEKMQKELGNYREVVGNTQKAIDKALEKTTKSTSFGDFKENLGSLRQAREQENQEMSKAYSTYLTQYKDYQGRVKELSAGAIGSMKQTSAWSKLKKENQNNLEGMMKGLDFSGAKDETQITSFVDKMTNAVKNGKFDVKAFNKELDGLKTNFNDTGNIDDYNKGIDALVDKLSKTTGIKDKGFLREMLDIDKDMEVSKDKLEAYMKSYGTTAELGVNEANDKLIRGFESMQRTMATLTDPSNYFQDKDGTIKVKMSVVTEILNDPDLPAKLKTAVDKMAHDGDGFTMQEAEVTMQLTTILEQGKVEGADKVYDQIQRILDGKEKPKADIQLGKEKISKEAQDLMFGLNNTLGKDKIDIKAELGIKQVKEKSKEAQEEVNGIKDRNVKVTGDNSNVKQSASESSKAVKGVKDRNVKITANTTKAVSESDALKVAISHIKSKGITVSASTKTAIRNVKDVALAMAGVKSKQVSLIVNTTKKITTWWNNVVTGAKGSEHSSIDGYIAPSSTVASTPSPQVASPTPMMTFGGASTTPTMNFGGTGGVPSNFQGLSANSVSTFATKKASTPKYVAPDDVYNNELEYLIRNIDLQKQLENAIARVNNQLEINKEKQQYAYGGDKLRLMKEEISLLNQQVSLNQQLQTSLKSEQNELKYFLGRKGFNFDSTGNLTNYVAKLQGLDNWIKGATSEDDLSSRTKQVDEIKQALEQYMNVTFSALPQAQQEWQSLSNSIKDVYNEQLQATKEIEDQIVQMYKKQIEDKKKAIQEESELIQKGLDKKLEAIDKEKEAYSKARQEDKWQEDYTDKQEEMLKLQGKMNLLSRDSSAEGKSKYEEVKKQFEDAKKSVDDMLQDKADEKVNEVFDKEKEMLQKEKELTQKVADDKTENLDNTYTDKRLQEMAKKDISTGMFTGINGEVEYLQNAMVFFLNSTGEGLGATGDIIKNELVANLNLAKDSMKDMSSIMQKMGLVDYTDVTGLFTEKAKAPVRKVDSASAFSQAFTNQLKELANFKGEHILAEVSKAKYDEKGKSPSFVFNESLVNITGNADRTTVAQLEKLAQEITQRVTDSITSYVR